MKIKESTNQLLKMERKIKISTLILGVIISILALSNNKSVAFPLEKQNISELKDLQVEMFTLLEQKIESKNTAMNQNRCLKFYNCHNQLVYECRDQNDERLKVLLRRSDIVLQTNTSSYYLLIN